MLFRSTLIPSGQVPTMEKITARYGVTYSNRNFFKNNSGTIVLIPYLSAILDTLYYQDGTDPGIFGRIKLINQDQVDTLDISDILDKKNYTSPNGVVFTNGLKVQFIGSVNPSSYQNQEYYVEGVGTGITLILEQNLEIIGPYTLNETVLFDDTPFDRFPFSEASAYASTPEYIVINRASRDHNPWSRFNRWFHKDVIEKSAAENGTVMDVDQSFRAVRPIIEFEPDLKLFNFGTNAIFDIDLLDDFTLDVFSDRKSTRLNSSH